MIQTSWKYRRTFMFIVSAFCMFVVVFVLLKDLKSGPADTAVTMSFITLLGIVGSYVFGATWDDKNVMRFGGKNETNQ